MDTVRPLREGVLRGRAMRGARGERSSMRRIRRSGERTRPRTRKARACPESARPDVPTRRPRKTRCTTRGGTTRTRSAMRAPQPGTGARHLDRQRARYSLLRSPLRGVIRAGIFIPCQAGGESPRRAPPDHTPALAGTKGTNRRTFLLGERVRPFSDLGGTDLTDQLTTGALLLIIGAVLTIVGIVFFPFLCVGVPLLIIGLIMVVAEGGRTRQPAVPPYPRYGPAPPYPPDSAMPPAIAPPRPPDTVSASPGSPPTRYCVNCGAAVAIGASFCAQCGASIQR